MKVVVKIGTQSILSEYGEPLEPVLKMLVDQIAHLKSQGHHVILVSSGAVGLGRGVVKRMLGACTKGSVDEKHVLASLGQHELLNIYSNFFRSHNMLVSQLLLTKQDFKDRQNYLNISKLLESISIDNRIVPIINENDTIVTSDQMFVDNDELAGLIAAQVGADRLVILSNVEGVYDKNPGDPTAKLIPLISREEDWPEVDTSKSKGGRGGMFSKTNTAKKMARLGITTHITTMSYPSVLIRILNGTPGVGTTILPQRKQSNIKRWMALGFEEVAGYIVVNENLRERLRDVLKNHALAVSILPVGIVSSSGDFARGDTVKVLGTCGKTLGAGVARYECSQLNSIIGQSNQPVFIHHDYLYLNEEF